MPDYVYWSVLQLGREGQHHGRALGDGCPQLGHFICGEAKTQGGSVIYLRAIACWWPITFLFWLPAQDVDSGVLSYVRGLQSAPGPRGRQASKARE